MATIKYSADDTALLIVDPYNDFMSEGGKLYERMSVLKRQLMQSAFMTICVS
jgi:hypothetical protein